MPDRARGGLTAHEVPAPAEWSPLVLYQLAERRRILEGCVNKPRHRELLRMHYAGGATLTEIAAEFGTTVAAISQMHGRILRRLRSVLEKQGVSLTDLI